MKPAPKIPWRSIFLYTCIELIQLGVIWYSTFVVAQNLFSGQNIILQFNLYEIELIENVNYLKNFFFVAIGVVVMNGVLVFLISKYVVFLSRMNIFIVHWIHIITIVSLASTLIHLYHVISINT